MEGFRIKCLPQLEAFSLDLLMILLFLSAAEGRLKNQRPTISSNFIEIQTQCPTWTDCITLIGVPMSCFLLFKSFGKNTTTVRFSISVFENRERQKRFKCSFQATFNLKLRHHNQLNYIQRGHNQKFFESVSIQLVTVFPSSGSVFEAGECQKLSSKFSFPLKSNSIFTFFKATLRTSKSWSTFF